MKKLLALVALIAVSGAASACGSPSAPAATPPPATPPAAVTPAPETAAAPDGAKLYQTNCSGCHGATASGGKLGETAVPDIRAAALQTTFKGDAALIKRAILNGKDEAGKDLNAIMPRQAGKLSDEEVTGIVQYLQSLK